MEIQIDREKCAGHAICTILSPEAFDMDDEGKAIVRETASQATDAEIKDAADACPTLAIKLKAGV